MSSSTPRPRAVTEEIVARFEPSAEASKLLTPGLGAADFVAALVEKELWSDAAGFVGQWLVKRDAVTWACLASRRALGTAPPPKEAAEVGVVAEVEAWVWPVLQVARVQAARKISSPAEEPKAKVALQVELRLFPILEQAKKRRLKNLIKKTQERNLKRKKSPIQSF